MVNAPIPIGGSRRLCLFSAFLAEKYQDLRHSPITPENASLLLTQPLRFQGSWTLIREDFNAVETRKALLEAKASDARTELSQQSSSWVIYRGLTGVTEEKIGELEANLLHKLSTGEPLATACDHLQQNLSESEIAYLTEHIQSWFQRWAQLGWFAAPKTRPFTFDAEALLRHRGYENGIERYMKIGIIGASTTSTQSCDSAASLVSNLPMFGHQVELFDLEPSEVGLSQGQQHHLRQRWKQRVYRQRKHIELLHCFSQDWADLYWCASTATTLGLGMVATISDTSLFQRATLPTHRKATQAVVEQVSRFVIPDAHVARGMTNLGCPVEKLVRTKPLSPHPIHRPQHPLHERLKGRVPMVLISGSLTFEHNRDAVGIDLLMKLWP